MNTFISDKQEADKLYFNADESWHCAKVLRMKTGEAVRVIDGKGNSWEAKLVSVHEKECVSEIIQSLPTQNRNYSLHIAIAPTKNMDRIEWFAEKATELGIDQFTFLICKNSERKIIKTDRVKKIVESAVKQSMQALVPQVGEAVNFKTFISEQRDPRTHAFIAHCEERTKQLLQDQVKGHNKFLVLIGPEGDFSTEEISLALQHKFIPVSLGESRLRTETAGVYTTALLRSIL
jgi:16S rRNA (uracil1498-N3)-methyltransferase